MNCMRVYLLKSNKNLVLEYYAIYSFEIGAEILTISLFNWNMILGILIRIITILTLDFG